MSKKFKDIYPFDKNVIKGLDALGYYEPTKVQAKVISPILTSQDLIVQSQTGSGKTGGFGIPIVEKLVVEETLPQVLVLTPTRELAVQVSEEIADIGRYKKIRCLPVYGKQPIHIQLRQLKQRVHVVVGTPGRVHDLLRKKHLQLEKLKYLVIDEADELLNRGFLEEVTSIIEKTPVDRTTLLFSATMPPEIETICKQHLVDPIRIEIAEKTQPIQQIQQVYYEVADDWKFKTLTTLLQQQPVDSCIIFCNTKKKADDLLAKFKRGGYSSAVLHGGLAQRDRLKAIKQFKEKEVRYLIATDLAARGIHIDNLDLVVNYNVPIDAENYVHRIGRTGRAGNIGQAITFVSVHDAKAWKEVQDFIGYRVPLTSIDLSDDLASTFTSTKKKTIHKKNVSKPQKNNSNPKHIKAQKDPSITKLRINAGKKKKIRPGDIVGTLCNINGITMDDIGIIDIQDGCSYIEIFHNKGDKVLNALEKKTIKGKPITVKKIYKSKY